MIPSIEDILSLLTRGECTKQQARAWIGEHTALALDMAADRDMFAAAAMGNMFVRNRARSLIQTHAEIARQAYSFADAMLLARSA